MPRKNGKIVKKKSTKRGVKANKKTSKSKLKKTSKPKLKKVRKKLKPRIKKNISLQSAEVVKLQKEFLKIEDEITRHIASRAPKIPFAKPQVLSKTYFASHEERMESMTSSLKKLKRE